MNTLADGLPSTGERLLTEWDNDSVPEHLHRYALAKALCAGKDVLDVACGEGYGAHLLSTVAKRVVGVDVAPDAVSHATGKYARSNLSFLLGNAAALPIEDQSIDVAVSFETLEHHAQHEEMLSELRRVLRPTGLLIISTPDKRNYSDARGYRNPYHVKELYLEEFRALIRRYFNSSDFYLQAMTYGSLIVPEQQSSGFRYCGGDFSATWTASTLPEPRYVLCLACNGGDLPPLDASIFSANENHRRSVRRLEQAESRLTAMSSQLRDLQHSLSLRIGRSLTAPLRWWMK